MSVLIRALVVLALAAAAPAAGASRSGLRGTVMRGPTAPVCRTGMPCSAPAVRTVLVFRRAGHVVRATTDAKGRYRVALSPGSWTVSLAHRTRLGRGIAPTRTRVAAGVFRTVDLSIDTGIR